LFLQSKVTSKPYQSRGCSTPQGSAKSHENNFQTAKTRIVFDHYIIVYQTIVSALPHSYPYKEIKYTLLNSHKKLRTFPSFGGMAESRGGFLSNSNGLFLNPN